MMDASFESYLAVAGLVLLALGLFVVYFIFKQIQFVLVAVNLYRRMVRQQDAIIKLLVDVRDNTRVFDPSQVQEFTVPIPVGPVGAPIEQSHGSNKPRNLFCTDCGRRLPEGFSSCPECKRTSER